MNGKGLIEAVAYFRTSSAANVGDDKDSESRQRDAVTRFAKRNGYTIVDEFYDPAVSGSDPITERPGFIAMLERIVGNGVRVILVETASRFARSVLTQEVGFSHLQGLGVTLIAVDSPESFLSQEPMMVALRQMQGVFSQLDKATLVAKLKSGRERKKRETGKGCGRKSLAELAPDGGGAGQEAPALPGQRPQALAQRGRGGAGGPGLRHPPRHPLRRGGGGAHGRGGLAIWPEPDPMAARARAMTKAGITPGLFSFRLGGGTRSAVTSRA